MKRPKEQVVLCGYCGRRAGGAERHVCDHGAPCGTSCPRCLEVDLFSVEGDERVRVKRHGLYEVEIEIRGRFTLGSFRRIATAIRTDWESGSEEARPA